MTLKKWLRLYKITSPEFALQTKIARESMWRYSEGQRIPPKKQMLRIYRATNGSVTPNDFYGVA